MAEGAQAPGDEPSRFWQRVREIGPGAVFAALALVVGGMVLPLRRPRIDRRPWPIRAVPPRRPTRFHGRLRG